MFGKNDGALFLFYIFFFLRISLKEYVSSTHLSSQPPRHNHSFVSAQLPPPMTLPPTLHVTGEKRKETSDDGLWVSPKKECEIANH